MAAVINEGSMNDILRYIEIGKKEGRLITGGGRATAAGEGYFIQPTVIADIQPKSTLEQEEIFGPVLAVIKSRNFDHALEIANDTEFGLTGAVYSSFARKAGSRRARIPRRQSVPEPQVHGRDGRRASVWRLQHVGHRFEGRRAGLSASLYAGQERG